MAIITEIVSVRGREYKHIYSDANKKITRGGKMWNEVYIPSGSDRTYSETDIPVSRTIRRDGSYTGTDCDIPDDAAAAGFSGNPERR